MTAGAVNPFELPAAALEEMRGAESAPAARPVPGVDTATIVENVLSPTEVALLLGGFDSQSWQPVGLDGIAAHYTDGDPVGSWRATFDSPEFADLLWRRLAPIVGADLRLDRDYPTDHDNENWHAAGVNPRCRCIRYRQGGLLVPHYDAPYDDGAGRRTLLTVVLYLGKRGDALGGATRFLHDPQDTLPFAARDFSDRTELARPEDIKAEVDGAAGSALVFPHRLLHDSEPLTGSGEKTIIRTDVLCERV